MRKTRVEKIFIIILCVALTFGVLINNAFKKHKDVSAINETNNQIILTSPTPEITPEKETLNKVDEDEAATDTINNLKLKINEEDNEANNKKPETDKQTFKLLYAEALYKKEVPSGVYTHIIEEFQNYLDNRYLENVSVINKIAIIEKSIEVNKKKNMLEYGIRLDKGSTADYAFVTVDLKTFKYTIHDVEIEHN